MNISSEYLAGFLDGEGGFGIVGGSIRVYVSTTNRPILERLQALCGGSVRTRRDTPCHRRTVHEWAAYGSTAEAVCRRVLPFLQEKLTQAALLVEYHNSHPSSERRWEIKRDLSKLKRPDFDEKGAVVYGTG